MIVLTTFHNDRAQHFFPDKCFPAINENFIEKLSVHRLSFFRNFFVSGEARGAVKRVIKWPLIKIAGWIRIMSRKMECCYNLCELQENFIQKSNHRFPFPINHRQTRNRSTYFNCAIKMAESNFRLTFIDFTDLFHKQIRLCQQLCIFRFYCAVLRMFHDLR